MPALDINAYNYATVTGYITRPITICLLCFLLLVLSTGVHGSVSEMPIKPERNDTVSTRLHPELEPFGLAAGSFLIHTKLDYSLLHHDNIFADDDGEKSDLISIASPSIAVASNWARHAVNFSANADLGRFREFKSERYNDWRLSGNVQVDASHSSRILFGAVYAHLHEPRDSPDSAGGLNPGIITSSLATLDLTYRPGSFSISPTASYNRLKYDDINALILGVVPVVIKQDDRDREEYILGLRGAYEVNDDLNAFIRVRSFTTDYDNLQKVTGLDRSSDGYEMATGIALDFGGITRGRFLIGYRKQKYLTPLPDISAPVFGVDLDWKPSELTSLKLDVQRDLKETTSFSYSGYVSTSVSINVDHEVRRNIILSAKISKVVDDFEGIGSAVREDDLISTNIGIMWRLNRNISVTLRHEYARRDTSDSTIAPGFPDDDFQHHVGWFGIELQQ